MTYIHFMNKRKAKIVSDNLISILIEEQKKRGVTNYQISKTTGLSESALSYIKDFKQTPTLPTLIMIADALNYPLSEAFKKVENLDN